MKQKIIDILNGRKQECYEAIAYLEDAQATASDDFYELERDIQEEEHKILFIDNLIYEIKRLEG